jgi:hypothetical protein
MNFPEALEDRKLLGQFLGNDFASWAAWKTFSRAFFGLPPGGPNDMEMFSKSTGRTKWPTVPAVGSSSNVSSTWTVKSAFTGAGDAMTAVSGLLDGVQGIGGFRPDLVSFGKSAWGSFAANSTVIAPCGGWVTPPRVAEVFRVNTVCVHDGMFNSVSGLPPVFTTFQTTDSISAFCTKGQRWGVRPYWLPPTIKAGPLYTEQYADEKARSVYVEVGCWTKEVVADANLAGTLSGVNSSQTGGL